MIALQDIKRAANELSAVEREELMAYLVRLVDDTPAPTPGSKLLAAQQAFVFSPGAVDEIMSAIEEACEQVNPDDWW
ncbi:MAG: hypothetical protein JNL42_21070 [Anaerolineae bacterium]|nr:hypothetical protein [Anaerolineae bacterium]